jgi:hypothetical protein
VPRSRHRAAKRIVQKAFGIGFAMQKALSVFAFVDCGSHPHGTSNEQFDIHQV